MKPPRPLLVASVIVLAFASFGCRSRHRSPASTSNSSAGFTLTSPVFPNGAAIPPEYTCDSENISPPLAWSGAPSAAKSFALLVSDPDAPSGAFVHWVLYNMPAGATSIPGALSHDEQLSGGAAQGLNDFHTIGYGGPCPPAGANHHYQFQIYALDSSLAFNHTPQAAEITAAMNHHIVATAKLIGTYTRLEQQARITVVPFRLSS